MTSATFIGLIIVALVIIVLIVVMINQVPNDK